MMAEFDWPSFLNRHGIEHVNHGPSTAKGNVYVKCPLCGQADHGHHMGISLHGRGWGCWRNSAHRGRNPVRLIAALLGISHAEAAKIAGVGVRGLPANPNDAMAGMLARLTGGQMIELPKLEFPEEFSDRWCSKTAQPFTDYLLDRGFTQDEISFLTEHYQLHFALSGDYCYRIIVPVYDWDRSLFTWTARAINQDTKAKYKTLSPNVAKPPIALGATSDILLDLPYVQEGGDFLVVTEGPFDAMRLGLFADEFQAKATCLFGKRISDSQISLLADLRNSYNDIFVVLDPDATGDLLAASTALRSIGVRVWALTGEKDPGELSAPEINGLLTELSLATEHH